MQCDMFIWSINMSKSDKLASMRSACYNYCFSCHVQTNLPQLIHHDNSYEWMQTMIRPNTKHSGANLFANVTTRNYNNDLPRTFLCWWVWGWRGWCRHLSAVMSPSHPGWGTAQLSASSSPSVSLPAACYCWLRMFQEDRKWRIWLELTLDTLDSTPLYFVSCYGPTSALSQYRLYMMVPHTVTNIFSPHPSIQTFKSHTISHMSAYIHSVAN